jgi:hypothetical protein
LNSIKNELENASPSWPIQSWQKQPLLNFVHATRILELHENIVTKLLNLALAQPTASYMAHEVQLLSSNCVNIHVLNASPLSL